MGHGCVLAHVYTYESSVYGRACLCVRVYVYTCTHARLHKQMCMICMCSPWHVCADMCVYEHMCVSW